MDYKEKYEQALGRAKALYAKGAPDSLHLEEMFPELKESKDERMRKNMREFLLDAPSQDIVNHHLDLEETLAWLEKQGEKIDAIENFDTEFEKQVSHLIASAINKEHEYNNGFVKWTANALLNYAKHELEKQGKQKPIDKIEPKFHAGDFITDGERIFQIKETVWERNNRNDGSTYCESLIVNLRDGNTYANNTDLKEYHLWTIQDAKDGDVLAVDGGSGICIFDGTVEDGIYPFAYYGLTRHYGFEVYDRRLPFTHDNNVYPATKEQRDLLFSKIKEAGYEWDSEKKELKKIEQKNILDKWKPQIGDIFRKKGTISPTYHLCNKREDGITFDFVENREVGISGGEITIFTLKSEYELVERLESIEKVVKEELNKTLSLQSNQEWSEEDEKLYTSALWHIKNSCGNGGKDSGEYEVYNWLKSLKPQPHWKPSKEQMGYLKKVYETYDFCDGERCALESLYNDLKKL